MVLSERSFTKRPRVLLSCFVRHHARPVLAALTLCVLPLFAQVDWEHASPASEQVNERTLDRAQIELARRRTQAFVVVRNGRIVYEWYGAGRDASKTHFTASLAKALVGGTSLMFAMAEGRVRADDPASKYIPSWREDSERSAITIRQLATHSSGIQDAEHEGIGHQDLAGWMGAFWKREPDPFTPALHDAPVIFPPGTDYHYSNPGMAALAYAVTASHKGAKQGNIEELLRQRVMQQLGIPDSEWRIGYGRPYEVDGLSLFANWGGGSFTPRATARVGQWMLQRGNWRGRQLVPPKWVDAVLRDAGTPRPPRPPGDPAPASGLGWWVNHDGVWPMLPRDAFCGAGAQNQVLLVVPSLDLVIVRNGGDLVLPGETLSFWGAIERFVFNPVITALADYSPSLGRRPYQPYPLSPVFAGLDFASAETVKRKAQGSDNWPITWADDGALYSAYGDGNGFEPFLPEKLSMGVVRVSGGPTDFHGENIHPSTIEAKGDDKHGKKASGMLAIGKRLYLMARNAENAQLAWSEDKGKSWNWAPWRFTESFGHPSFVQYGKAYEGSADKFVYIVSQDASGAYTAADQMVMARAPKDRLLEASAWEYFAGLDDGKPRWSRKASERAAVFENPGRCYRSSMSYHAPSGRYLWVQIHPGDAPRFTGGFGVYDAPAPWGPWTTVSVVERWDMGPGENAHFPTPWMAADGRTLYMVFSGDDAFSVRAATLVRRD